MARAGGTRRLRRRSRGRRSAGVAGHDRARLQGSVVPFLRGRVARLRLAVLLIAQAVSATSASWALAQWLLPGEVAVFAPIAALITLTISLTHRLRRVIQLVLGVALGVLVGDLLVVVTGTGVWQLALIVSVSMIAAILVGGSQMFMVQAGATGIIIATVTPVSDLLFSRVLDVLIGAVVGLVVSTVLLPVNPVVIAHRAATRLLTDLADAPHDLADALRLRASARMQTTAELIRAIEVPLAEFTQIVETAAETARVAPFRWREQDQVHPYLRVSDRIGGVVRNLGVLTRRSQLLLNQHEDVPAGVPDALDGLAQAIEHLLADLTADRTPERARAEALQACRQTTDMHEGLSITGQVILAQLRSTAVDLLRSTGLSYTDADKAVRAAITEPRIRRDQTL